MTPSCDQDGRDAKAAVLDALGRSGDRMADTLASCRHGWCRVPGMVWNITDVAVHLVTTLQELTRALHREPCAYDGANVARTTAAVDNRLVAEFPVRDLSGLAELFDAERARFATALAALDPDHPFPAIAPHATALAIGAIFVVDHNNHGSQLASAGGPAWRVEVEDVRRCVAAVVPATYDRAAAANMSARFALHLRGAAPLSLVVQHGTLTVGDVTGPVDCHISADPGAFMLQSAGGFVSRLHLLLHLELLAYGRRVWAMLALPELLPAVEHGGKVLGRCALRKEAGAVRREIRSRAASEAAAAADRRVLELVDDPTFERSHLDPAPVAASGPDLTGRRGD